MVNFRFWKRSFILFVALLLYVAGSSILGLTLAVSWNGVSTFGRPLGMDTLIAIRDFWRVSVPADIVFIAGSVAVAVLMVRRTAAVLFGFPLSVLVYWLALSTGTLPIRPSILLQVLSFNAEVVVQYGYPGLIFAAIAPLIWMPVDRRWPFVPASQKAASSQTGDRVS